MAEMEEDRGALGKVLRLPVGAAREAYLRRKMPRSSLVPSIPPTGFGGNCVICGRGTCASEFVFAGQSFYSFICDACS